MVETCRGRRHGGRAARCLRGFGCRRRGWDSERHGHECSGDESPCEGASSGTRAVRVGVLLCHRSILSARGRKGDCVGLRPLRCCRSRECCPAPLSTLIVSIAGRVEKVRRVADRKSRIAQVAIDPSDRSSSAFCRPVAPAARASEPSAGEMDSLSCGRKGEVVSGRLRGCGVRRRGFVNRAFPRWWRGFREVDRVQWECQVRH